MWGRGWGGNNALCSALASFPITSVCNWSPSSCCPGVSNPNIGGSACILGPRGSFNWTFLRDLQFLWLHQHPLFFYSQKLWSFISQCWKPGLCSLAWGWDGSLPRCPSWFLSTTRECGTTHSAGYCHCLAATILCPLCPGSRSPPLLPIWMNISSLNPWLSDFHTVWFSGSTGYILFWG